MDFAFLIHSRDYTDVQRKFKIAKFLPKSWVEFWCLHWPPVVVSKITGLKDKDGKECKGWLIGIPMTAKQMMENREMAKEKIIQAIKKAEKLGARIVGLGALTSSITNGGLDLINETATTITSGNALTAGISFKDIDEIIQNNSVQKIGIIGATGSIGQAVTKLLIKNYPQKEFILFAHTKKNLDNLTNTLSEISPQTKISGFIDNLIQLKEANLILVATSAPNAFIGTEHIRNGAIIYDITQPQNISLNSIKERPDLKIYDGGLVIIPQLECKIPLGLPKKTVFACLAETILLSLEGYNTNFSMGKVELGKIQKIMDLAKKYKFRPAALRI
jgi:predicted amino acid dehydrogenase